MTEILALLQSFDFSMLMTAIEVAKALGIFWPAVKVGAWAALFLWCFWVLYVATMAVYRLHLAGELKAATTSKITLGLCYSLVGIAVIVDAIAQYTLASMVFLELPRRGEHLVTDRLQRHLANTVPNWRSDLSDWICLHALDLFDPTRNHCNRRSPA